MTAFIRQYGMAGDPGPRPAPKRKSAGAGPKMKAKRKRDTRARRAARGSQGAPKGPGKKGKGPAFDLGAFTQKFGGAIGKGLDIAQQFVPGGAIASKLGLNVSDLGKLLPGQQAALEQAHGLPPGSIAKAAKGKGGRKRRNPANVKALRGALHRVEGFGRLVKRVNRMLPSAHRFQVHPVMKHKRRRKSA